MKYGIITDIHNNAVALRVVLKQLNRMGCDRIICCGDIIGIGPYPEETVRELVRIPGLMSVRGNHEGYLLEGMPAEYPNDENMSVKWNTTDGNMPCCLTNRFLFFGACPNRLNSRMRDLI